MIIICLKCYEQQLYANYFPFAFLSQGMTDPLWRDDANTNSESTYATARFSIYCNYDNNL